MRFSDVSWDEGCVPSGTKAVFVTGRRLELNALQLSGRDGRHVPEARKWRNKSARGQKGLRVTFGRIMLFSRLYVCFWLFYIELLCCENKINCSKRNKKP